MNEKNFKIELADIRFLVEWTGNRIAVTNTTTSEKDRYNDTHTHTAYEVFFITDGALTVITHNKKLECRNSIVIIPPQLPHCTFANNAKASVMYFKLEQTPKNEKAKLFDKVIERLSSNITTLEINESRAFYIKKSSELKAEDFFADERLWSLLTLLFADIVSELSPPPKANGKEKHKNYVNAIQDYLSFHYNEKLPITDLADFLYLSPKQVARIIRKEYNCTFSEMLTSHRLEVARMLLVRSDIEINKIAAQVGYEYPANFFKHFKKAYGIPPAEYRKAKSSK